MSATGAGDLAPFHWADYFETGFGDVSTSQSPFPINSVAEGVEFAKAVNRPSIRVLADFYHMDEENEPLETLLDNRDWLAHIHVADTGRLAPGTGVYPYARFVDLLRHADYDGMVSVECSWKDFVVEAKSAVEFLRSVFG